MGINLIRAESRVNQGGGLLEPRAHAARQQGNGRRGTDAVQALLHLQKPADVPRHPLVEGIAPDQQLIKRVPSNNLLQNARAPRPVFAAVINKGAHIPADFRAIQVNILFIHGGVISRQHVNTQIKTGMMFLPGVDKPELPARGRVPIRSRVHDGLVNRLNAHVEKRPEIILYQREGGAVTALGHLLHLLTAFVQLLPEGAGKLHHLAPGKLLALTQLLELPSPEGFAIIRPDAGGIDPSAGAVPPSPDEIYQEAITFKPEIKAELYRLKSTEMNIKIAQSALLPTLSLNAGIGSNYYKTSGFKAESFGRQMRNNFSQYIGLSLNVPIFNRFATRNSIRSAKLERETQQLQLDNVRKNLYKEIQQAYYNTIAARAKYESSMEASRSNKAAFDLMSAKYEYGKANITEFNEAKNNWLKAESDLVIAKYEYVYDTSLIDFYRGKELDF